MAEWRMDEQQVKMAIQGLNHAETGNRSLDAQRVSNSRISAHSLYVLQNAVEKAKDIVSVTPTYRNSMT
jgi:hypothetical protein